MRKHRRNHITYKNTTANDLADILKEAENITLDNLDFNKTFREQGKILCDIKQMLGSKNNDNKPFVCNPIISSKLSDTKFQELYENFKKGNSMLNKTVQKSVSSLSASSRITKYRKRNLYKASSPILSKGTLESNLGTNIRSNAEIKSKSIEKSQEESEGIGKGKSEENKQVKELITSKVGSKNRIRKLSRIKKSNKPRRNKTVRNLIMSKRKQLSSSDKVIKSKTKKTIKRKVKVSRKPKNYKIRKSGASTKANASTKAKSNKTVQKTIKIGNEYNVNNDYPIVIIKKRLPRKNVIYLNK